MRLGVTVLITFTAAGLACRGVPAGPAAGGGGGGTGGSGGCEAPDPAFDPAGCYTRVTQAWCLQDRGCAWFDAGATDPAIHPGCYATGCDGCPEGSERRDLRLAGCTGEGCTRSACVGPRGFLWDRLECYAANGECPPEGECLRDCLADECDGAYCIPHDLDGSCPAHDVTACAEDRACIWIAPGQLPAPEDAMSGCFARTCPCAVGATCKPITPVDQWPVLSELCVPD